MTIDKDGRKRQKKTSEFSCRLWVKTRMLNLRCPSSSQLWRWCPWQPSWQSCSNWEAKSFTSTISCSIVRGFVVLRWCIACPQNQKSSGERSGLHRGQTWVIVLEMTRSSNLVSNQFLTISRTSSPLLAAAWTTEWVYSWFNYFCTHKYIIKNYC